MPDLSAFRAEISDWLEENCPAAMRSEGDGQDRVTWGGRNADFSHSPDLKKWLDAFAGRGWTTPMWPSEYGGGGLSKEENTVLQEEMQKIGTSNPLTSFGISMLGPVLLEYGTEAQKQDHLPKIIHGEIRWCQGYSEPGAGSDLAGLMTKCEDKGDHYEINGSKIWTSYANDADWIFCLVRTDFDAPKHQGISFVLFDMDQDGVETRPILLISGESPFCQTFFDDAKAEKNNLIGKINDGWTIAKKLLQHERAMISGMGSGGGGGAGIGSIEELAKEYSGEQGGRVADNDLRHDIADFKMDGRAFGLTLQRSYEETTAGEGQGAASSLFKYYGTEQNKRRFELLLRSLGSQSLGWEGEGFSETEIGITRQWLRSKANSIEGGTSEIQLNVIAKRVLELPD